MNEAQNNYKRKFGEIESGKIDALNMGVGHIPGLGSFVILSTGTQLMRFSERALEWVIPIIEAEALHDLLGKCIAGAASHERELAEKAGKAVNH